MYTIQHSIDCMHTINGHAYLAKNTLNMTLLLLLLTHAGMAQQNTDVVTCTYTSINQHNIVYSKGCC